MANPFIQQLQQETQFPEYAPIQRQRQMAEMLLKQGMTTQQGQMVSGHYVAPSITQLLAQGLGTYMGTKGLRESDDKTQALAERLKGQREAWMGEMPRAMDNTSQAGPVMPQKPTAEDYMAWALKGQQIDPQAAQMGMQSANMALSRDAQAEARAQQEQFRRDQLAQQSAQAEQQRALQLQIAQMKQQGGEKPYFQPVQTGQGIYAFNSRTGKMELVPGNAGAPVIGSQSDPNLQGQIAGAKAGAQVFGKEKAEATLELPKVVQQGEEAVRLVDELLAAPGFKQAVGGSRLLGMQKVPGTSAYDFDVRLNQLKGKQFLEAFQTLKGGGQITEVEGKKATEAIARMDAAQSEEEFIKAAREFQGIVKQGVERAKGKAGSIETKPSAPKRLRFDAQGNIIP